MGENARLREALERIERHSVDCVKHDRSGHPLLGTEKTRGHLGSQLERKAETCLRMEKREEVTTLWSEKARHCNLPKSKGVMFAYDIEAGMHVLVDSANDARAAAAKDELTVFAASVFSNAPKAGLPWNELINRIKDAASIQVTGARKRMEKMHAAGIIRKNLFNNWEFAA